MASLRLLLQREKEAARELELTEDQVITIGRSSKATFQADVKLLDTGYILAKKTRNHVFYNKDFYSKYIFGIPWCFGNISFHIALATLLALTQSGLGSFSGRWC